MTFKIADTKGLAKIDLYQSINRQFADLVAGERDMTANLANASSLLYAILPDLNWAGFYLLRQDELILGPFQGKPACMRITIGKGVCGTAAESLRTQLVQDVHEFPGHIACDIASRSEIVLPLVDRDEVVGVLDLDSPLLARFDKIDRQGLDEFVTILLGNTDFIY